MLKNLKANLSLGVRRVDPVLLLCTVVLLGISLLTIWGSVENFGMSKLRMQLAMGIMGVFATFVVANLDYHIILDRLFWVMLIFSAAILAVTLVAGSTGAAMETTNKSWLTIPIIGIDIQPSEFVKITFICTFSKHLWTVKDDINHPKTLVGLMIHAGLIVGLILLSGDLGVALVYMALVMIMLFCAGLHLGYFGGVFATVFIALPFLWDYLAAYQQDRILVGFKPELDPLDRGWQPLLSRQCIENGGLFGVGLFGGGDYEQLAASHTDFILASVAEKFGFLGVLLVMAALVVMVLRILWIARRARRDDGMLLCIGVAAVMVAQILENVGMCLGVLPVVGLTLPFVSCGGSSLLATFMLVGIVHSVNAHRPSLRMGR